MLTRIISAAVGIVIIVVTLILHETLVLPIVVAGIIAIMLFELLRAVKLEKCYPILISAELCGISMPFIYGSFYSWSSVHKEGMHIIQGDLHIPVRVIDGAISQIAFGVTLLAAFVIFVTWLNQHKKIRYEQIFFALAAMVLVPHAMTSMILIESFDNEHGVFLLTMGLCGAWIADSGAYFSGVALGKHKLCPEISPKKTIEGLIGGILTTGIVYTVVFSIAGGFSVSKAIFAFVLGAACAVIGTVGDLSASMIKRQIGFKDYGKIMPGHGGLMDRFDSVLFVLPTFYVFLIIGDMIGFSLI